MALAMPTRAGRPIAAINVTPLADVMIVLLIIFMVVTPLVSGPQGVRLPPATNARKLDTDLTVRLGLDGSLSLSDRPVASPAALRMELAARLSDPSRHDRTVYLQADREAAYRDVMAVVDACREAGGEQIALLTAGKVG